MKNPRAAPDNGKHLIAAGLLLLAALPVVGAAEIKEDVTNTMNTVAGLFQPFWKSDIMDRESLFFFQRKEGELAWAPLLFTPEKILSVRCADGQGLFEEGKDFVLDREQGALRLVAGSRIPFKTAGEMYPPPEPAPKRSYLKRGAPHTQLLAAGGHYFHDRQVEITYTHPADGWKGWVPVFQGDNLPITLGKLKQKQPVKLFVTGDSISADGGATKLAKVPPFQPVYPELVVQGLEQAYGSKVAFRNVSVGGTQSGAGAPRVTQVGAGKVDLVIIAFGMNDACNGKMSAEKYAANIKATMDAVRTSAPDAEFVLVASMLPNAEWNIPILKNFPAFRDSLATLCGKGVVLADLTSVWTELLKRKSFYDLTSNGLNHPNDFGRRIYAEVILALLVPPDLAATIAGAQN